MATYHVNQQACLSHSQSLPSGSLEYLRRPTHSLYPRIHCCRSRILTDPVSHILTTCPLVGTDLEWRVCHGWKTLGTCIRRCCLKVGARQACLSTIDSIMHHRLPLVTF